MTNIYFIHYELRPAPHSEDFATTGGAFALCYVQAADTVSARIAAERYFEETDWIVVDLENGPEQVERELYEDEPDMLDAYDEARTTLARADEIVIVATPELANLRNTKNILDTLRKMRPNDFSPRLVLNQVGVLKRPEITPADFCDPLGIDPMAIIPFDALFFGNAANNGRMLAEADANHATVKIIGEMAHVVTGRSEVKSKKKPGLQGILAKLRSKKA